MRTEVQLLLLVSEIVLLVRIELWIGWTLTHQANIYWLGEETEKHLNEK